MKSKSILCGNIKQYNMALEMFKFGGGCQIWFSF